jgi:hypothetical protein
VLRSAEMLLCGLNVDRTVFPDVADGRNARMSRGTHVKNVCPRVVGALEAHADSSPYCAP